MIQQIFFSQAQNLLQSREARMHLFLGAIQQITSRAIKDGWGCSNQQDCMLLTNRQELVSESRSRRVQPKATADPAALRTHAANPLHTATAPEYVIGYERSGRSIM